MRICPRSRREMMEAPSAKFADCCSGYDGSVGGDEVDNFFRYPDCTARNSLSARGLQSSLTTATWCVSAAVSIPATTFIVSLAKMEIAPQSRSTLIDPARARTSGLLQEHLRDSKVVKGFNHNMASQITTDGKPAAAEDPRALATGSDYPEAAELVTRLCDEFSFDTVNIGLLEDSWRLERDRPA